MWKITPIDLGALNVPCTNMLHNDTRGIRFDVPVVAWLLTETETGRHVLVDSGAADDPEWGRLYHNPVQRTREEQYLPQALKSLGVDPESIDTLILTHLHWDHAYGVKHCPNAKVIVQKEELFFAVDPTHKDAKIYETTIKDRLPYFFAYYNRLEVVEGDVEIEPGISVVTLPGHSPGSHGVLVDTAKGKYLIAGDIINVLENLTERTPGSLYTDMEVCQKSFAKAAEVADVVLPAHDYRAFAMLKEE